MTTFDMTVTGELMEAEPTVPAIRNGGMPAVHQPQENPFGRNAGPATLTGAQNDIELFNEWLGFYTDRARTFESYQREGQRLLDWCTDVKKIGLRDMMVASVQQFYEFLLNPPAELCVQPIPKHLEDGSLNPNWKPVRTPRKHLADGTKNPEWRPFTNGGLSKAAANQAILVIGGLFEYAASVGYISHNPVKVFRKRMKVESKERVEEEEIDRYLEPAVWEAAIAGVETMPQEEDRQVAHHQRSKFALKFLYFCGLRRDEMSKARTSHLKLRRGKWGLVVKGKGKKVRRIPLPAGAVEALREYREALGRTPWPAPTDDEPLIMDIYGVGRALSGRSIYDIVTEAFEHAAQNEGDPQRAQVLREASTHWLRHTCASHMLESQVPLKTVQRFLGHSSIAVTSRYLHTDWDTMHEDVQRHTM